MPNIESFKTKEEYREWYRNYRNKNKEKLQKYGREFAKAFRHKNGYKKDDVRIAVLRAIKKGILKKGNCEVCNADGAEGHHFDYSQPLKVIWLCPVHHKDMHRK